MVTLARGFGLGCAVGAVVVGAGSAVWTWLDSYRRVRVQWIEESTNAH